MSTTIDLALNAYLPDVLYGPDYSIYDDAARDFLALLRLIEGNPAFDLGWSYGDFRLWSQVDEYIADSRIDSEAAGWPDQRGSIFILDDAKTTATLDDVYYGFDYSWGRKSTILNGNIKRPHPRLGVHVSHLIQLVETVTRWKRPQHLAFGPLDYMVNHQPLDRSRLGIRWMGWVPFQLAPSDVPEAEIVRPMNDGTLIVTQSQFWQVGERHPDYSADAIRRAQNVELRLNSLGVLPTVADLHGGNWGGR